MKSCASTPLCVFLTVILLTSRIFIKLTKTLSNKCPSVAQVFISDSYVNNKQNKIKNTICLSPCSQKKDANFR